MRVYPHGQRLGIQVGWRVVAINGNSVGDGKECGKRIRRAHRMDSEYEVLFTDDAKRRQKMVEMNDERNTMMAALRAGERRSWALSQPRAPAPPVLKVRRQRAGFSSLIWCGHRLEFRHDTRQRRSRSSGVWEAVRRRSALAFPEYIKPLRQRDQL